MEMEGFHLSIGLCGKTAFSVCMRVCCMQDASLIFISGYKSNWLCCGAGQRAVGDGGGGGGSRGCSVSAQGSLVSLAHMTPCITVWIFMRRICCSRGDSSHLARAEVLHRKWLYPGWFGIPGKLHLSSANLGSLIVLSVYNKTGLPEN